MNTLFSEALKTLRQKRGLSQNELAERMIVTRATVTRWESGLRLPDATMIARLADVLSADVNELLNAAAQSDESPNIIIVDDNKVLIKDSMPVLEEVFPNANVTGFIWPKEAIEYAKTNPVALAILDIEMGTASGFDLCGALLEINPRTNIVYLTSYPEYAFDALETNACGFMVKPLTPENVRRQLKKLHYLFPEGCEAE